LSVPPTTDSHPSGPKSACVTAFSPLLTFC
jgi:hypothetical protein